MKKFTTVAVILSTLILADCGKDAWKEAEEDRRRYLSRGATHSLSHDWLRGAP